MAANPLVRLIMKVVIAGGSGFIGDALVAALQHRGEVKVLSRNPAKVQTAPAVGWDPPAGGEWEAVVAEADAVVNLAGAPIAEGRWTEKRKKLLVSSRVDATRALVSAIEREPSAERVFISASGIGIYPDRGDEPISEDSPTGTGFFPDLARSWEAAAHGADHVARVVIARFGVILGRSGGALEKMLPPFRMGVGGALGSGRQWMPWISLTDTVRAVEWMIDTPGAVGAYNVVAPHPVRNADFSKALGSVLKRPSFLSAPAFALRAVYGEMAQEALLSSQRVIPSRLLEEGFVFEHQDVRSALVETLV